VIHQKDHLSFVGASGSTICPSYHRCQIDCPCNGIIHLYHLEVLHTAVFALVVIVGDGMLFILC
jgi:hypothetical protein